MNPDIQWGIHSLLASVVGGPSGYVIASLASYFAGRIHERHRHDRKGRT